jgi:hypothetical protein
MAENFPELVIRKRSDLADAFLAIKTHLGLSNSFLEELCGGCAGFTDKYLGRSRSKRIGPTAFDLLLSALGLRLRVEIDPDQAQLMAPRYERRNEKQVRTSQPLSAELLERARAIIMATLKKPRSPAPRPDARRRETGTRRGAVNRDPFISNASKWHNAWELVWGCWAWSAFSNQKSRNLPRSFGKARWVNA